MISMSKIVSLSKNYAIRVFWKNKIFARNDRHLISNWNALTIIFLVVSAIMLPMPFLGIPDGFDLMQHVRFAAAYHDSFTAGIFFPGWAADDNFGFGSIGIRYYPPLAYYFLAVIKMLTGNWYDSFWITSFIWLLLGCTGVYFWVKEWLNNAHAVCAAVVYAVIPYHTFQIYQAVLVAEFAAGSILPFCFLFVTRICRRQQWADVILFSVAFSLLILTHIPTTIIATPCMAIYVLLILDKSRIKATAIRLGSAFVLTSSATAFHLAKLITEKDWVLHNSPQYYSSGYYDYHRYFFPLFYSSSTTYVEKLLWQLDIIVAATFLLFLPSAVYLIFRKTAVEKNSSNLKITRSILATGLFCLFMLTIASSFIWNYLPILQKIQFPWRWLVVASLFASVSFSFVIPYILSGSKNLNRAVIYPLIFFILLLISFDITQSILPSTPLSREVLQKKIDDIKNNTGCECWWPIWVRNGAFENRNKVNAGWRNAQITNWNAESREFAVDAGKEKNVRIATFYHPHWKATVNGDQVPVEPDENGAILIPLPNEAADVHLFFQEPAHTTLAILVSLITWIMLAILVAGPFIFNLRRRSFSKLS